MATMENKLPGIDLGTIYRPSTWFIVAFVLTTLGCWIRSRRSRFPVVNAFTWDFMHRRSYSAFMQNAQHLTSKSKMLGPVAIKTPSGLRIILPSSLTSWAKANKDLDHQELVRNEYFATYPGFEGNAMIHHPNHVMVDTIKKHMSQNGRIVPIMNGHVTEALAEAWTEEHDWHSLQWSLSTTSLISRAAASVFVGPILARDKVWQSLTIEYTRVFFAAVLELWRWPTYLRPIVHWFLPGAKRCRVLVKEARNLVNREMQARQKEALDSPGAEHFDAITWTEAVAGDDELDQGAVQLGFAIAALHTTAEALRNALLDLCANQEMMEPLRAEVLEVFTNGGVSSAALSRLHLLESFLKESQRLHPPVIVNLERQAIRDTSLPDGRIIPRGSVVQVDGSDMWDPDVYSDPEKFDGRRFFKARQAGNTQTAYVSSTKEHCVFGMGKHICPGRFLAATELKLCMAHIILKYDIQFGEGYTPRPFKHGFFRMADPDAKVRVKRRVERDATCLDTLGETS